MSENSAIQIPENLMSRFKAQAEQVRNGGGIDPSDQAQASREEYQSERSLEVLESLNETLSWICETGDKMAKQRGYPGLGEVPPDQLGDLVTIVAKRNLPSKVIEKSPEVALVTIMGGVAFQNYLAFADKAKQRQKTKTPENNDD